MILKSGNIMTIDWLCLDGKPRSAYRIVEVQGNRFWYYRIDSGDLPDKLLDSTIDSLDYAVSHGELQIRVTDTLIGQS
jgi:hypothetical protein